MDFFKGNEAHQAIRICVNLVKDDVIFSGKVSTEAATEEIEFYDIQNLLLEIEFILNNGLHPAAGKSLRHFKKGVQKNKKDVKQVDIERGKREEKGQIINCESFPRGEVATVILYVTQRRHATWQGRVYSMENGNVMNFKSELEFLKNFMDIVSASVMEGGTWKAAL